MKSFYLFLLAMFCLQGHSQSDLKESTSIISRGIEKPEVSKEIKKWNLQTTVDLSTGKDSASVTSNKQQSLIREASLSLGYQPNSQLQIQAELTAEEFYDESEVYVSQLFTTLNSPGQWASVKLGQMFYPIGILTEQDHYFLNLPAYYSLLFRGRRGLDLGAQFVARPLNNSIWSLSGGCFEGRTFRPKDGKNGQADAPPCFYSSTVHWRQTSLRLIHFQHDFAFFDAVTANGLEFKSEVSFFKQQFNTGLWAEAWSILSEGPDVAPTVTESLLFYPYIRWKALQVGYRWAPQSTSVQTPEADISSKIQDHSFRVQTWIFPEASFVYEETKSFQEEGVTLSDAWSLRFLLELEL